jgi:hypothetical protein
MIKDSKFEAQIDQPIKLDETLNVPDSTTVNFSLSGHADRDFLRSLMRLVKRHSKIEQTK